MHFYYTPDKHLLWHKSSLWQPNNDEFYTVHDINVKHEKVPAVPCGFGRTIRLVPHI